MSGDDESRWSFTVGERGEGERVRVYQRNGSGNLYLAYWDSDEERTVRRSLGHDDRERAKREAVQAHRRKAAGRDPVPSIVDDHLLHEDPVTREAVPMDGDLARAVDPFGRWRTVDGTVRLPDLDVKLEGDRRRFLRDVVAGERTRTNGRDPTTVRRGSRSYLYLVQAELMLHVKIGRTRTLKSRVRKLAHVSPEPLRLVAWIRGGAEATERHLHAHFGEFRSHGEWFRLSVGLVKLVDHLKAANAYMARRTKPLLLPAESPPSPVPLPDGGGPS